MQALHSVSSLLLAGYRKLVVKNEIQLLYLMTQTVVVPTRYCQLSTASLLLHVGLLVLFAFSKDHHDVQTKFNKLREHAWSMKKAQR